MRFSSTRLATGPRIHYAETGDPGGEPVVLLHGWPDSWFSYSRLVPLLPGDWRRIVPDQRGFGESDKNRDLGYTIHDLGDDVIALLDALSIERATLVGHSMGTFVARSAAIAHPERVMRLALIGSGWCGSNPVLEEVEEAIRDLPDPVPLEFAREFQASTIHKPVPDDFFEGLLAEAVKLPAPLWRELFHGILAYDDLADLRRIEAPTLLLWGERDGLFPRADQERLAAAIPGARLEIYADIGHCPNWECPERVAGDLAAFVAGR